MYNERRFKLLKITDFEVGGYKSPRLALFCITRGCDYSIRQSHRII